MAKKLNMSAVKEYLFNHGEKVALGTCAFLALLLGGLGLWSAMSAGKASSGKPWAEEFEFQKKRISQERNGAQAEKIEDSIEAKLKPDFYDWTNVDSKYQPSPYVFFSNDTGSKRLNPPALAINQEGIHVDYVRGIAYTYDIQQGKELRSVEDGGAAPAGAGGVGAGGLKNPGGVMGGGGAGAATPLPSVMRKGEPVRMVVVTAVFPMKKQVEEFQRALKMLSQDDMFTKNRDDLPKPLGINVVRYELVNNQWQNETRILMWDGTKVLMQQPKSPVDDLLRVSIYDEDLPKVLAPYLWEGLVTPLPKLANAHYPRFNFPGFNIAWDELDKGDLAMAGGGGPMPPLGMKGSGGGAPPPPPMGGGSGDATLPGMKNKKDKNKPPMGGMPETPTEPVAAKKEGKPISSKDLKEADRQLWDRLFGKPHKYNVYHILGRFQDKEATAKSKEGPGGQRPLGMPGAGAGGATNDNAYFSAWDIDPPAMGGGGVPGGGGAGGPMAPPMPGGVGGPPPKSGSGGGPVLPGGKGPGMPPRNGENTGPGNHTASTTWERDAIVRFIDPGVVPGKTYKYAVQVRLANPNYEKRLEVVAGFMAQIRELLSEWRYTPQITIPGEYHLYALDQHLLDMWAAQKVKMDPKEAKEYKLDKNQTTFQIHQWTDRARDTMNNGDPLLIGDWAIAERVAVHRGEEIGVQSIVHVPAWKKEKDIFEIPTHEQTEKSLSGKTKSTTKRGLRMDFQGATRPYLVDFSGGKRAKLGNSTVEEETAVEAIILMPDGTLKVLNSRADADHVQEVDDKGEPLVTRNDRVHSAQRIVQSVVRGGNPNTPAPPPKDTTLPGKGKN